MGLTADKIDKGESAEDLDGRGTVGLRSPPEPGFVDTLLRIDNTY